MMAQGSYGLVLAGALSCAGLAACGGAGAGEGEEAADAAIGDGEAMGASLAGLADDELGEDPPSARVSRLGGILAALDGGEVAQADVELDLGADAAALDFAALMSDEHAAHAAKLEAVLADRRLTPIESSVSVALRAEAYTGISELQRAPRVRVDFAYLQLQVKMHAAARVLVDRLSDLAPSDVELIDFLDVTRDAIADHRREAEAILRAR